MQSAPSNSTDVTILGGGLAGLTLAIQLKQKHADVGVTVLERREHPVPLAAHKVGESSVEIGAHYFETVLGLKQHLMDEQIKKFGFRFFFNDGAEDLTKVTELGASMVLPTPSYQIDRGHFENSLAKIAQSLGVQFHDGAIVRKLELSERNTPHVTRFSRHGEEHELASRWVVDASGRAGLIKRKLNLAEDNHHNANAVWFRISDRLDVNEWTTDQEWVNRCSPPERWRSTSHLCGEGYWVWLIPLSNGSHSVGIVCDADLHPLDTMNTFDKAMTWFAKHQPQLHRELEVRRDKLQDFAFFRHFSYGCKQVFNGQQRWALTGEAGLFLDPFYSPGSDFIAMSNTFITELISQDRAGARRVAGTAGIYEQLYFQLYQNMLTLYEGQYKLFGDPEVMPVKVIWDYTVYWGLMCPLFMQGRLTDVMLMARMGSTLNHVQALNIAMQRFLRAWGDVSARRNPPQMLDQAKLPWFKELNRGLLDTLASTAFDQRIAENMLLLNNLAQETIARAKADHPQLDASAVQAVLDAFSARSENAEEVMLFKLAA
jgi:flavin-dependent dehydrogenase